MSILNSEEEERKTKYVFKSKKLEHYIVLAIIIGLVVYFGWQYFEYKFQKH